MKAKIYISMLMLICNIINSQTSVEERKERTRIAACKIKSVTQTAHEYVWDQKAGTRKPSPKGVKISTLAYDAKGNVVEEITYNQYGNIDTKTAYKYTGTNPILITVTGSDGMIISKTELEYRRDTISTISVYKPDGSMAYSNYTEVEYRTDNGHKSCSIFSYSTKDSSLVGSTKSVYDNKGNLIDYSEYNGRYLTYRDVHSYNAKGWKIETELYNKSNDFAGSQKFKYDPAGNLIQMDSFDMNSLPLTSVIYKGDGKGNFVEAIKYDHTGKPLFVYRYFYQYY